MSLLYFRLCALNAQMNTLRTHAAADDQLFDEPVNILWCKLVSRVLETGYEILLLASHRYAWLVLPIICGPWSGQPMVDAKQKRNRISRTSPRRLAACLLSIHVYFPGCVGPIKDLLARRICFLFPWIPIFTGEELILRQISVDWRPLAWFRKWPWPHLSYRWHQSPLLSLCTWGLTWTLCRMWSWPVLSSVIYFRSWHQIIPESRKHSSGERFLINDDAGNGSSQRPVE